LPEEISVGDVPKESLVSFGNNHRASLMQVTSSEEDPIRSGLAQRPPGNPLRGPLWRVAKREIDALLFQLRSGQHFGPACEGTLLLALHVRLRDVEMLTHYKTIAHDDVVYSQRVKI
jgi:hypothetical protein